MWWLDIYYNNEWIRIRTITTNWKIKIRNSTTKRKLKQYTNPERNKKFYENNKKEIIKKSNKWKNTRIKTKSLCKTKR